MKLEILQVIKGCRLGILTGLGKSGQLSLETPGCLLYTRCGSVPHLTQDTLHTLTNLPAVTQLTLASLAEHQEVLEEFKEGARKFAGLHDTVVYCSLLDPATTNPPGYITTKTVSVWGSGGRIELTLARFMALQKAIQPDWYQSMADGETCQEGTSRKRVRKAVDRTLSHLDECLNIHQKTKELEGVEVFGVLEGGDIQEERLRSARETSKRPVAGFVLDGFQSGAMANDLRTQLISMTTAELPQDKPRLLQGVGRPDEILDCVEAGVDLFESFFPFQVTERGCALCFDYHFDPDPEKAGTRILTVLNQEKEECVTEEAPRDNGQSAAGDVHGKITPFEMNLRDERYREDFGPLVPGCTCYCCLNHQRAYVHHLLVTNELLAGVLLMLHNLAHYLGFFLALRRALAQDRLPDLRAQVLQSHHKR